MSRDAWYRYCRCLRRNRHQSSPHSVFPFRYWWSLRNQSSDRRLPVLYRFRNRHCSWSSHLRPSRSCFYMFHFPEKIFRYYWLRIKASPRFLPHPACMSYPHSALWSRYRRTRCLLPLRKIDCSCQSAMRKFPRYRFHQTKLPIHFLSYSMYRLIRFHGCLTPELYCYRSWHKMFP